MSANPPTAPKPRPSLRRGIDGLTEQQANFVAKFSSDPACIGNATAAALAAGYSAKTAHVQGCQMLKNSKIRAAIDAALREQISSSLAARAVRVLHRILDDPDAPARVLVDCAKAVLDRAGIMPPTVAEREREDDDTKPLAEMTAQELQLFIDREEAALAELRAARPGDTIN
jgi:phage terminase small subunit